MQNLINWIYNRRRVMEGVFANFIEKIAWCLSIQFQLLAKIFAFLVWTTWLYLLLFSTPKPFNDPLKLSRSPTKQQYRPQTILFFYRHFSVITWCYINPTWSAERTHLFQPDRNNQIIVSVLMDYLLFPTDLTENSFRSGRIRSVSSDWCGYIKYLMIRLIVLLLF